MLISPMKTHSFVGLLSRLYLEMKCSNASSHFFWRVQFSPQWRQSNSR